MGPFGAAGLRREVKASIAPFQWPRRPDWFGVSGKSCIEASSWYHKCHICCPREDWILPSRIMSISHYSDDEPNSVPKRVKTNVPLVLSFSEANKQRTIQPHDDALMVTLRIGGYDVRKVMIDQGSAAEIMYPDLFKGLGLKPEDLTTYSSHLVSFEGKMIVPRGQIRLSVQTGSDVVEVDFIVVDAFSPYTAIMGRP